jgi:hypothetical protein
MEAITAQAPQPEAVHQDQAVPTNAASASATDLNPTENSQIPAGPTTDPTIPTNSSDEKDPEQADQIPDDATETVYLNNLNERVKLPGLSTSHTPSILTAKTSTHTHTH